MEEEFGFGQFIVHASRRVVTRNGEPVVVGSRALDILLFLARHAGEVKSNAEIFAHVWPDTFVDDANLRVHISALRKIFEHPASPNIITNIPGRGYVFVAELLEPRHSDVATNSQNADMAEVRRNGEVNSKNSVWSRSSAARILGRDALIEVLVDEIDRFNLVTIVGPGGIGKSIVAGAVVARSARAENVIWVDLSEVELGNLIPTLVATALGIVTRSQDLVGEIAANVAIGSTVMVLDCCEHLVDGAASFCEELLERSTGLSILTTSREPLRAAGERVHRLPPLELPDGAQLDQDALQSPAVQLFIERASGFLGGYEPSEQDIANVTKICERLDGIPLAIELAAGRLETIGIEALAKSLEDSFRVLTRGRRTALPRHQTLSATLDWSYLILSGPEKCVLREISVFRGRFTDRSASAISREADAAEILASLVAKSLLVAEAGPTETNYRLLDTTRLYARQKLVEEGEEAAVMRKLLIHLCELFDGKSYELSATARAEQESRDFQLVASLRVSLQWAFAKGGDPKLGARLTVVAVPLFFRLSLLDECLRYVTEALSYLDARPGLDERSRMQLYAALGWPQLRAINAPEHGIAAWSTALSIARKLDDLDYQLRAVWALWVDALNRAEPKVGLQLARDFQALADQSPDIADTVIGRRLKGATFHWLGRHLEAKQILTGVLEDYDKVSQGLHSIRFQFDQRVTVIVILARVSWVLGDTDGALAKIGETLDYLRKISHDISLCILLAEAGCPIAILSGRYDLAREYIKLLREHTKALSLDVWHCYADCFEAELLLKAGQPEACLRKLKACLAVLEHGGFVLFRSYFNSVVAQAQLAMGQAGDAMETIETAIAACIRSGERWCLAELYRVQGLVFSASGAESSSKHAWHSLQTALVTAKEDQAVGWERKIHDDLTKIQCCVPGE